MDLPEEEKVVAQNDPIIEQPTENIEPEKKIICNEPNIAQIQPIEEMLGSVTTYNNLDGSDTFGSSKNCQQVRTSARVFKKMKLDSALAVTTSPAVDKDKKDVIADIKIGIKRPFRPQWTADDKDLFFEAINEYGKDFDALQQYLNNKFKKKGLPDSHFKSKEQVRHFFHRTAHKVSKHVKFSEDIKKVAQELYVLINYGELRKKAGSVSEKTLMKLNELIYRGSVTLRVKGKTVRIRTPMCRALRKLNQLDDNHEDLKLPARILVELHPKNMETWLNVQFMSQNPLVRINLPLQRRLSALLNCVNERWKTQLAKAHENLHGMTNSAAECTSYSTEGPLLRVAPLTSASIEMPIINLSEYLTSHRVCLNAYEERIGVKVPGEQLWVDMCASFKGPGKGAMKKAATKRQRNESTGEKPTIKQKEICDELEDNPTTVSDVIDTAINTILSLQTIEPIPETDAIKEETKAEMNIQETIDSTLSSCEEEEIGRVKNGWTLQDCGTLTVGEMYLMFGNNSKIQLEYSWDPPDHLKTEPNEPEQQSEPTESSELNPEETPKPEIKNEPNQLSSTLKKLLSLAKLHYRKERVRCPCGHVCGGPPKANSASRSKSVVSKAAPKIVPVPEIVTAPTPQVNCMRNVTVKSEPMFRKPAIYPMNGASTDSFRAQLDSLQRMRPKYTNRKGRPVRSKHVVVERMLPLLPKPLLNGHSLVTMKVISPTDRSKLRPIAPRIDESSTEATETVSEIVSETEKSTNGSEFEPNFFLSLGLQASEESQTQPEAKDTEEAEIEEERPRVSSPTSISNFLNLEIPGSDSNVLISGAKDGLTSFAGLLSDDLPGSTPLSSPSRILKENDNQWLNSEVNDYSLTSLLGHLESPLKTSTPVTIPCDDTPISQDIDSQFPSLLGENGVDFVDQFVDMAAQVDTEASDEIG